MRTIRFIILTLMIATSLLAGYLTLSSLGVLGEALADVKRVPAGHQEVAFLAPATSFEAWERFVASVALLEREWPKVYPNSPKLIVNLDKAFLPLTADVPEIAFHLGDCKEKMWVRWYKLTSELDGPRWVQKLAKRKPAPLAIVGGDTSDRALALAQALNYQTDWKGSRPILLITTATADRYLPRALQNYPSLTEEEHPKLMDAYKGRSFRYSFTNTRMAEAIMEFLRQHPQIWLTVNADPSTIAASAALGHAVGGFGLLAAAGHFRPYFLYTLAWIDDGYSKDLADRFLHIFRTRFDKGTLDPMAPNFYDGKVKYGVGDYFQPNPAEVEAVELFLSFFHNNETYRDRRRLLVLPTGNQQARRFLRTLCRRAPLEIRNIVVASGDSITWNHVYRDRDFAWNIQDMPVPFVFFSHRNPIDPEAGFGVKGRAAAHSTGTQDLLLDRDIIESLVQAAFQDGKLLSDADRLVSALRKTTWCKDRICNPVFTQPGAKSRSLFDAEGNRQPGTGEHIVWVRPMIEDDQPQPRSTITVWSGRTEGRWSLFGQPLEVRYDRSHITESHAHVP